MSVDNNRGRPRKDGFIPNAGTREWFQEATSIRQDCIAIAPFIHNIAGSLLDENFLNIVETNFDRTRFASGSSFGSDQEHRNIVDSIAGPVILTTKSVGKHREIDTGNPLFKAMVVRVYLIHAGETIKKWENQEQLVRRRIDPQTKEVIETLPTVNLKEEARKLAEQRSVEIGKLQTFIDENFPEGEERKVATLLGYAVEFPKQQRGKEINEAIRDHGLQSVLPRLRTRAVHLGDIDDEAVI